MMNKIPTLEELIKKKGPKEFVKDKYYYSEVEEFGLVEDEEGPLLEVTCRKKKQGYEAIGTWDLWEIEGDEVRKLKELKYPLEDKGTRKKAGAIGAVAGLIASIGIYSFLGNPFSEPTLFGKVIGTLQSIHPLSGSGIGYGIGKRIEDKTPAEIKEEIEEIKESYKA